jgi:hypothetical protein
MKKRKRINKNVTTNQKASNPTAFPASISHLKIDPKTPSVLNPLPVTGSAVIGASPLTTANAMIAVPYQAGGVAAVNTGTLVVKSSGAAHAGIIGTDGLLSGSAVFPMIPPEGITVGPALTSALLPHTLTAAFSSALSPIDAFAARQATDVIASMNANIASVASPWSAQRPQDKNEQILEALQKTQREIKNSESKKEEKDQKMQSLIEDLINRFQAAAKTREATAEDREAVNLLKKRIDAFLHIQPWEWKCYACREVLDKIESIEKIETYLGQFAAERYKPCKARRHRNQFVLQDDGNIIIASAPISLFKKTALEKEKG